MNAGNGTFREVIYMIDIQGPEKVNSTYVKTMHVRTMIEVSLYCISYTTAPNIPPLQL